METNTQLTLADLASIHNLLEAATSRGAFKASELSQVGAVYDKLSAFLAAVQAQQEQLQQQQQEAQQAQGETNA